MGKFMLEARKGVIKKTHSSNNKYSMIKLFIKYSFSRKVPSLCLFNNETGEVLALQNEYEELWLSNEFKGEIVKHLKN